MGYELVVFDLDGTLVDSLPDIARALNHALAGHGYAPVAVDVVRTLVGDGVSQLVARAQALQPRPDAPSVATVVADLVATYEREPCVETDLYPGMADTLDDLRRRARRLAVLTNKPASVTHALLAALNIQGWFDVALGDGEGFPRKPDPAALLAIAQRLGVSPASTLMVGDGLPDMHVAAAAGVSAAAALWGYTDAERLLATAPRHALDRPGALLEIV